MYFLEVLNWPALLQLLDILSISTSDPDEFHCGRPC